MYEAIWSVAQPESSPVFIRELGPVSGIVDDRFDFASCRETWMMDEEAEESWRESQRRLQGGYCAVQRESPHLLLNPVCRRWEFSLDSRFALLLSVLIYHHKPPFSICDLLEVQK